MTRGGRDAIDAVDRINNGGASRPTRAASTRASHDRANSGQSVKPHGPADVAGAWVHDVLRAQWAKETTTSANEPKRDRPAMASPGKRDVASER